MTSASSYISIGEIVSSILFKKGKTIHTYFRTLKFAADGVRELALSAMSGGFVKHKLLRKDDGQTWFELPPDYSTYVSVGIRCGERWRPVTVDSRIMPFPNEAGGGQYNDEHNDQFNTGGAWTNWLNPQLYNNPAAFDPTSFNHNSYNTTTATVVGQGQTCMFPYPAPVAMTRYNYYYENTGGAYGFRDGERYDTVAFNPMEGIIMCPLAFPSNELYLVYIGLRDIDSMTFIDIKAQNAVEAYVDWKTGEYNRNVPLSEKIQLERKYKEAVQELAARFNPLTMADIIASVAGAYGSKI